MRARRFPRIKVCCIASPTEAWAAIDAGASALGLVTAMPSGAGIIDDELAGAIARSVPPGVDTFLLTSRTDATAIIEQHARIGSTTLQLVDSVETSELQQLRAALPGIRLVQVIHVGEGAIEAACIVASYVDAVLLDSGRPFAEVRELGGTGRRHDWTISARIREMLDVPIFLAGGLNPENVAEAIATVGPYGLDVCNGLRVDGALDSELLDAFFRSAGSSWDRSQHD